MRWVFVAEQSPFRLVTPKVPPMLEYDFEESVGCWIVSTANAVKRALDAELQRAGITSRQWEILATIACEGERSQNEIGEQLGIEAPTLSGLVDRMERDGWIERVRCPEDGRRRRLRPTEKAESVWSRCVECCHRVRAAATRGLDEDRLRDLRETCERIRENLRVGVPEAVETARCAVPDALEST